MQGSKFASPTRSTCSEIDQATQAIVRSETFTKILNLYPEIVLILDKNRQAVYCNKELLRALGIESPEKITGKRPGEIFNCVNADREAAGCGTSEFCRECGAVNAILVAQTGKTESGECRITIRSASGPVALDLRVWASPVEIEKVPFTFFVIRNIGDEKRRAALEHVFFHDILNDTTILKAYTENVRDGVIPADPEAVENIHRFSKRLAEAITNQRDLLLAEEGSYAPHLELITIVPLLEELVELYQKSPQAKGRTIRLETSASAATVRTDTRLLWRILGNAVKNALEASPEQVTVTIGFKASPGETIFSVNGPAVMTEQVQHQVFQRSFSTHGAGRGLGTYSMKLFTEKYLKGRVWFESKEGPGTTFFVALPS